MSKLKAKSQALGRKGNQSGLDNSLERRRKIAEAAYYKAEARGFAPGKEEVDWLEAEQNVDSEASEQTSPTPTASFA